MKRIWRRKMPRRRRKMRRQSRRPMKTNEEVKMKSRPSVIDEKKSKSV